MDFTEKELQEEIKKLRGQLEHWTKELQRAVNYQNQCRVDVIRLEGQIAHLEEMTKRKPEKQEKK